jgi:hypothetical protein
MDRLCTCGVSIDYMMPLKHLEVRDGQHPCEMALCADVW